MLDGSAMLMDAAVVPAWDMLRGSGLERTVADGLYSGSKNVAAVSDAAGSFTKPLGAFAFGVDVYNATTSLRNWNNGEGSGWQAIHDLALVAADVGSDAPVVPPPARIILGAMTAIDVTSNAVFDKYFEEKYKPADPSEVFGPRALELLQNPDARKKQTFSEQITPNDPNDIIGPAGFGADEIPDDVSPPTRFDGFVPASQVFDYRIVFENKPSATAPAQVVTITHQLDADLDWATFELGDFGFGAFTVDVPSGRTAYDTTVDATGILGVLVRFEASFDITTGLASWVLTSVDPKTGDLPLDPFGGFLPANVNPPEGDGFVLFSVRLPDATPNGTVIEAQATIVFDFEDPIATPLARHIVDALPPASAVAEFAGATTSRTAFRVAWAGSDPAPGSGLVAYRVFVAENGGAPAVFYEGPATAARFVGAPGSTYAFSSVAVDGAGNTESAPGLPDATISVVAPDLIPIKRKQTFTDSDGDVYTVKIEGKGALSAVLFDPEGDGKGPLDQLFLTGGNGKTKIVVSVVSAAGDGLVSIGDFNASGDFGSFIAKKSDLVADGVLATGSGKKIQVRDVAAKDPLVAQPEIRVDGAGTLKVIAAVLADGFSIQAPGTLALIKAAAIGAGTIEAAAVKTIKTTAGDMAALVAATGNIGTVDVKGGDLTGTLSAGGKIGKIVVRALDGAGGNAEGATVAAARIGSAKIAGDVSGSHFLAGAALGADFALGGSGPNADQFFAATFGNISVGGNVTASVFAAGLDPANGVFNDGDDAILGGTASTIKKLVVAGGADGDSYFAAGAFIKGAKIAGTTINPASDPRFKVA